MPEENGNGESKSSVKIIRNAKGDTQLEVKVYVGEAGVDTVDQATAKAREVYESLRTEYPL